MIVGEIRFNPERESYGDEEKNYVSRIKKCCAERNLVEGLKWRDWLIRS
jgi:hypothetical protein